jgi:hypothetical protein
MSEECGGVGADRLQPGKHQHAGHTVDWDAMHPSHRPVPVTSDLHGAKGSDRFFPERG